MAEVSILSCGVWVMIVSLVRLFIVLFFSFFSSLRRGGRGRGGGGWQRMRLLLHGYYRIVINILHYEAFNCILDDVVLILY
jgi:hypothetical protein